MNLLTPRTTDVENPGDPRLVFRLLILYRWISLVPPLLFIFSAEQNQGRLAILLLVSLLPNLLITFASSQLNQWVQRRPWLLLADFLLVAGCLGLSGGEQSPYYLYALSPLIAAGFFFQLRGAIVATTLFLPLYTAVLLLHFQLTNTPINWLTAVVNVTGFYLISGAFGYAAVLLHQLQDLSQEQQQANQNLAVLHNFTAALHQSADVDAIQEVVLKAVTTDLGFGRALIGLADGDGLMTGWLHCTRQSTQNVPGTVSFTASLSLTQFQDGLADDQLCQLFELAHCLPVPLLWGIQPIGLLLVETEPGGVDATRRRSLEALARQTAVAISMMQNRLRRAKETAVQAERARIALEMHDTLSQSLFGIVFTLDGAEKLLDSDPSAIRSELLWARETAESARQEIRRAIHDLWSEEITPEAFQTDLHRYANDVLQANTLDLQFDIRGSFNTLSPRACRSLYRMTQECLTNIVHHAAATEARVCVDVENGRARLVVRDNGRGFEPDIALAQEHGQEHFGLRGMQNRAYSLGGTCDIFSQPEAGTSIVVDIPTAWPGNGTRT
ncbi:MAG: GAF domain-containing sensor histidine kinase [Anaerolineales bacterium]|nr:GAF domain-containing sensor histidine kinase [Anaerolineales bacterium]MCB8937125.1 GAF domain-containing sensor histidine kinase [Ardenticatenaceae bacterium]